MRDDLKEISELIKKKRKEKGYSQKELAELCECSLTTIQGYEQGRFAPTGKRVFQLPTILDAPELLSLLLGIDNVLDDTTIRFTQNDQPRPVGKAFWDTDNDDHRIKMQNGIATSIQRLNDDGLKEAMHQIDLISRIPDFKKES